MGLRESIISVVADTVAEEQKKMMYMLNNYNKPQDTNAQVQEILPNGQVKITINGETKTIESSARQTRVGDVVTSYGGRSW